MGKSEVQEGTNFMDAMHVQQRHASLQPSTALLDRKSQDPPLPESQQCPNTLPVCRYIADALVEEAEISQSRDEAIRVSFLPQRPVRRPRRPQP